MDQMQMKTERIRGKEEGKKQGSSWIMKSKEATWEVEKEER